MVDNINLNEMQNNLNNEPVADPLAKLQAMGVGQDITPFYKTKITPNLINLPPDYSLFFNPKLAIQHEKMLNSSIAFGYEEGGTKPVYFNEERFKDLSFEDRMSLLYSTHKGFEPNFVKDKNLEASKNRRDTEGVVFIEQEGGAKKVNVQEQDELNIFQNLFGNYLPFVTGPEDIVKRKLYEEQLTELGLTPEKAKQLREQLKESYYYRDFKTGKIKKHEESKDLSYLIPTEGDASNQQQAMQILGRITSDFPSLITGIGVSASKQYTKTQTQPNEDLLDIYKYVNGRRTDEVKTTGELRADFTTYADQLQEQAEVVTALSEKFDEIQNTNTLFMSFKQHYKNLIYNNTGFVIDGKLLDELSVQNPDESILFHVTDTAMESAPYVAIISGVLAGFGLKGTKLADETLDYALKNSGPGLKYAHPIEAANSYFQIKKAQGSLRSNSPNKFVQYMQRRFEQVTLTQSGVTKLKTNLSKEIDNITIKIRDAARNGDTNLVNKLMIGQETLIARQAGLTVRHFTTAEKSLFRNEIFAATFGGVGDRFFGVNSGVSIGMELAGALSEPAILPKNGFSGLGASVILRVGALINFANVKFIGNETISNVANLSKANYLNVNFKDLKVVGDDGIERTLTLDEAKGVKALTDLIRDLPAQRRAEVLGTMNALDEKLDLITRNLTGQEKQEINVLFGQMTGLAALQALDELYAVKIEAGKLTTDVLKTSNDYMTSTTRLLTEIDNNLSKFLGRSNQTPEYDEFISKINTVVKETKDTIATRQDELAATFDIVANYVRTGNLFDNTNLYQKNLEEFVTSLKDLKLNGASEEIRAKATQFISDLDNQIFKSYYDVSKSLMMDGSNYRQNSFPNFIQGMYAVQKAKASRNYTTLFDNHSNVKIDFTEFFDEIIGETVDGVKFGKLQNPINKFSKKLPSSFETNSLKNVIESSVTRNTKEFISNKDNHNKILDFLLSDGFDTPENTLTLLTLNQNLSKQNTDKIFESIQRKIKKDFVNYENVNVESIGGVDVRNALQGELNTKINVSLNLEEAMDFRSGIGFSQTATKNLPENVFYTNLFNDVETSIFNSINEIGDESLLEDYKNAINGYADFSNRFNNFDFLERWTKTKNKGTTIGYSEDATGETKKTLVRIQPLNEEATQIANKFDNQAESANHIHVENPATWINPKLLLSDENYADKFIREVFLPTVGTRNVDRIGQADEYFLDFNNPQTIQMIEAFSKYLSEDIGAYIRRTEAGEIINKREIFDEAIKKDTPGTLKGKKIQLFNGINQKFAIDTPDGKIFLLPVDDIININVGIDTLIARNTTVNNIAKNDQVKIAFELKAAKNVLRKQLENFKFNVNKLSDTSVIVNFGEKLTEPDSFVKNIVVGGRDNYDKLYRSLVTSGKMTKDEFNTVSKNLISEYFYNSFSRPAEKVETVIRGTPQTSVNNYHVFDTASAREFLSRNKEMLTEIYGEEHLKNINDIIDIQALMIGADTTKLKAMQLPDSLRLESLMSRLYAMNRGVISPRYVATEVAIRRFNKNKGVLIKTVLENPKMANVVKKILQKQDPYTDPAVNAEFKKLLDEGTTRAIILRLFLEDQQGDMLESEEDFLQDLSTSLRDIN